MFRCYSLIGRDGGQQQLSLGVGCYRKGIAIHEVMHLLGFFHEQSRLDRDDHVTVNYGNAQLGKLTFVLIFNIGLQPIKQLVLNIIVSICNYIYNIRYTSRLCDIET